MQFLSKTGRQKYSIWVTRDPFYTYEAVTELFDYQRFLSCAISNKESRRWRVQCESTQWKVECVVHQSNMKYTEQVCFCQNKLFIEIALIVLIHTLLHFLYCKRQLVFSALLFYCIFSHIELQSYSNV